MNIDTEIDLIRVFGARLNSARQNQPEKLTIKKLSRMFFPNISEGPIGKWERGHCLPRENLLPQIARFYGIDEAELRERFLKAEKQKNKFKDAGLEVRKVPSRRATLGHSQAGLHHPGHAPRVTI